MEKLRNIFGAICHRCRRSTFLIGHRVLRQTVAMIKLCPLLPSLCLTQKKRCNRLGTFTYPPTKRYRTKSSQEESHHPSASVGVEDTDAAAALASLKANAQDAEEALQMPEDLGEDLAEEDFAADEEAAAVMRGA